MKYVLDKNSIEPALVSRYFEQYVLPFSTVDFLSLLCTHSVLTKCWEHRYISGAFFYRNKKELIWACKRSKKGSENGSKKKPKTKPMTNQQSVP